LVNILHDIVAWNAAASAGVEFLCNSHHLGEEREGEMSVMKSKATPENNTRREFPREAYDYKDDVTKEALDKVRKKAAPYVEKADLELVDGLGIYSV